MYVAIYSCLKFGYVVVHNVPRLVLQVRTLSPRRAAALIAITAGGLTEQHWMRYVHPLNNRRLLIYGKNPHIPGMTCLHFVSAVDGRTLLTEWRYRRPSWVETQHISPDATVIWQVRASSAHCPITLAMLYIQTAHTGQEVVLCGPLCVEMPSI